MNPFFALSTSTHFSSIPKTTPPQRFSLSSMGVIFMASLYLSSLFLTQNAFEAERRQLSSLCRSDEACSLQCLRSFCFHRLVSFTSTETNIVAEAACPPNFSPWYDGVCGYIQRDPSGFPYNYSFASSTCRGMNAYLPSVHSNEVGMIFLFAFRDSPHSSCAQELDLFANILSPNYYSWLGLTCTFSSSVPVFKWDDGTPFNYSNFGDGNSVVLSSSHFSSINSRGPQVTIGPRDELRLIRKSSSSRSRIHQ